MTKLPRYTVHQIVDFKSRNLIMRVDVWTEKGQSSQTCSTAAEALAFYDQCKRKAGA